MSTFAIGRPGERVQVYLDTDERDAADQAERRGLREVAVPVARKVMNATVAADGMTVLPPEGN